MTIFLSVLAALAGLLPTDPVDPDDPAAPTSSQPEPVLADEVIQVHGEAPAVAQSLTAGSVVTISERGVAEGWLVLPDGHELGAELRFMMSRGGIASTPLAFTDIGLLTLRARSALGHRMELLGTVDLLPKQPAYSDELIWQGAALGLRMQPGKRPIALSARLTGGPMLASLGGWGQGGVGVDARKQLHEVVTLEGGASATATHLRPAADAVDPAWLVEASIAGAVLFRDPEGWTGGWIGFGYSIPIVSTGSDPMSRATLDPQPRLDLQVGAVLAFIDHWDLFARFAFVDRGDLDAMATRLPILDGGFDQRQLVIGIAYHLDSKLAPTSRMAW